MKRILLIFTLLISYISISQDLPRLETDSLGRKYVILSYEQAQKVDNTFELVLLLEKAGTECDSTVLSYIKVVDKLERGIAEMDAVITLYKGQIIDKNNQISNLTERLRNSESDWRLCDEQIKTKNSQIELLNGEISDLKTKRNIAYGAGVLGIIIGVLVAIVTN